MVLDNVLVVVDLKVVDPELGPSVDQVTTKERSPHSQWLVHFALGSHVYDPWAEYLQRRKLLQDVKRYRQEMKREPIARQIEIVFPLNLT